MRTIIGLFVTLILILSVYYIYQKSPEFKDRLMGTSDDTAQTTEVADSDTTSNDDASTTPVNQTPVTGTTNTDTTTLVTCSNMQIGQNCSSQVQAYVCSQDKTTYADGSFSVRPVTYVSECQLCNFFGSDNSITMGDTTVSTLGYQAGICN